MDLNETGVVSLDGPADRISYVNAKYFDFSGMEHSGWATATPPLAGQTLVVSAISLLLDLPSMDVYTLLRTMMIIGFIACVVASFGFYLFCCFGVGFAWLTSLVGGVLYVLGNFYFARGLTGFYPYFFSVYIFLPFALLLMTLAIRYKQLGLSWLSGATLMSSAYLAQSHPEFLFHGILFAGCYFCFLLVEGEESKTRKLFHVASAALGASMAAGHAYFAIFQSMWQGDFQILGHQESSQCQWLHEQFIDGYFVFLWTGTAFLFLLPVSSRARNSLLKNRPFLYFSSLFVLFSIATLPGCDSPLLKFLVEVLKVPIFNLRVPDRMWTFLYLYGLISGLFCLDLLVRESRVAQRGIDGLTLFLGLSLPAWFYFYYPLHPTGAIIIGVLSVIFLILLKILRHRISGNSSPSVYAVIFFAALLNLLHSGLLGWPNVPLDKNPKGCESYISFASLLTKYLALKEDIKANTRFLRGQLIQFENLLRLDTRETSWVQATEYSKLLKRYHIQRVAELQNSDTLSFALEASPLIDDWYLNSNKGCLFTTEKPYNWGPGIWHNLASLFLPVAGLNLRSASAAGDVYHFGVAEGLILNDATVIFDGAYHRGYGPLHALYVSPRNYYEKPLDFSVRKASTLFFGVEETIQDSFRRKIFNISGIDTYTILGTDYEKVKHQPELVRIPSKLRTISGRPFELLRDSRSYGVAYAASKINYVSENLNTLHKFRFPLHRNQPENLKAYKSKVNELWTLLQELSPKHAVYLEDSLKSGDVIAPLDNSVDIIAIKGARAVFQVECRTAPCIVVYNVAAINGWKAYAESNPLGIHRANFAFMGVEVPLGKHTVWFEHERLWGLLGRYITLLAAILATRILIRQMNKSTILN